MTYVAQKTGQARSWLPEAPYWSSGEFPLSAQTPGLFEFMEWAFARAFVMLGNRLLHEANDDHKCDLSDPYTLRPPSTCVNNNSHSVMTRGEWELVSFRKAQKTSLYMSSQRRKVVKKEERQYCCTIAENDNKQKGSLSSPRRSAFGLPITLESSTDLPSTIWHHLSGTC